MEDGLLHQIQAAEELIIEWCGDEFGLAPDDTTAREYECRRAGILLTDRFLSAPEAVDLATDITFEALTRDEWKPDLAPSLSRPGRNLVGLFYLGGVYRVTAQWGWAAVPGPVSEAATLMATRLFARQTSPLGVLGGGDSLPIYIGSQDADVTALLRPYATDVTA